MKVLEGKKVPYRDGSERLLHFPTEEFAHFVQNTLAAYENVDERFGEDSYYMFISNMSRSSINTDRNNIVRGLTFFMYLRKNPDFCRAEEQFLTPEEEEFLLKVFNDFNKKHSNVFVGMSSKRERQDGTPMQGRMLYYRADFPVRQMMAILDKSGVPYDTDIPDEQVEELFEPLVFTYYSGIKDTLKALSKEIERASRNSLER